MKTVALCVFALFFLVHPARAYDVWLVWDPSESDTPTSPCNYRVYINETVLPEYTNRQACSRIIEPGTNCHAAITGLVEDALYFAVVTARYVNLPELESSFSEFLQWMVPWPPVSLRTQVSQVKSTTNAYLLPATVQFSSNLISGSWIDAGYFRLVIQPGGSSL